MITISLCMIVKNEEAVLRRCLESAAGIADEIIIVDTGSTDKTASIAHGYTGHVYSFEWRDDFSAARNFSFSKATKDYILWLDADDIIPAESRPKLAAMKETLPADTDGVMLPYCTAFDSGGKPTFSFFRERLVRRTLGALWREPVHEHLSISGKVINLDAAIHHMPEKRAEGHSERNLRIYRARLASGEALSTRGMFYFARELKTHGLWDEAIAQYRVVFARPDLWKEDGITACQDISDCYIAIGAHENALQALFSSFIYDLPRAEALCRIGALYIDKADTVKAVFWYELALSSPKPDGWGFLSEDAWGYVPHAQLCMLYDRMGEREKALAHHEAAKRLKPESAAVQYNERYFYPEANPGQ